MRIQEEMRSDGGVKLISMADFQDDDGVGIKMEQIRNDRIRIKLDSYNPFGDTIYLNPDDVLELGAMLVTMASEMRKKNDDYQENQEIALATSAAEYIAMMEYDRSRWAMCSHHGYKHPNTDICAARDTETD